MLSTMALRSGAIRGLVRFTKPESACAVLATQSRIYSSNPPQSATQGATAVARAEMEDELATWRKANEIFYGPDRDLKNFPIRKVEVGGHVRHKWLPGEWFDFYSTKGGHLGPYIFGTGFLTFLVSKQYWVVDHGFVEAASYFFLVYLVQRKYGEKLWNYLTKVGTHYTTELYEKPVLEKKDKSVKEMERAKEEIVRLDAVPLLFEAKKENVALQLESAYRQRLHQIHKTFKQRLDYKMEIGNAFRRVQQEHMVHWITGSVSKNITPQLEKDSIANCIQTLKKLSVAPS